MEVPERGWLTWYYQREYLPETKLCATLHRISAFVGLFMKCLSDMASDAQNIVEPSVPRQDLRSVVLQKYSSSNDGPHRRMSSVRSASWMSAYRYYLKGCLPNPPSGPWVDLGCGQGALLQFAQQQGYTGILGVDASKEMLGIASETGMPVELGDVREWLAAAPSEYFKIVSAFDLMEHFSRDDGFDMLRQIRRILEPNGVCLLQMPNAASPWCHGVMASDLTHETAYSALSISQLAKLAGFAFCEVKEMGPPPGTAVRQIRRLFWFGLRQIYRFANLVETGSAAGGVYTRVMLVKLWGVGS